jgi:hypothetical protein
MSDASARWSPGKRVGFVFLGVFLCLNIVPDMLGSIPVVGELVHEGWRGLWAAMMPVLGNATFGIDEPILVAMTGSGDMLWNYVQTFWFAVLALVAAVAVAALDRRRAGYARAYAWLRVLVRYALALAMFSYGFAKLVGNQFGFPGPMELARTYGDSSPMGLVWTFMGYSTAYTWFTGLAEILAGALLLSRRTATLGSLVACGVMANVVALNFCYDVPVKLYSSLLLLMAAFLAAHDARRLIDLLILNRPTAPLDLGPHLASRRARVARVVAKSVFVLWIALGVVMQISLVGEMHAMAKRGPLYGVWEVDTFRVDGTVRPPDDAGRWRQMFVGEYDFAIVRPMQGERVLFGFTHDAAAGTVEVIDRRSGAEVTGTMRAEQPAPDRLVLRGKLAEGEVEATMRWVDTDKMLLVTRGFRWVNDRPFNR